MLRLMIVGAMASVLAGCATGTCKDPYVATPRKPASTCSVLWPYLMRVKGRVGGYSVQESKVWNERLASRGYAPMNPNSENGDLANYLANIPEGGYGVVINAGVALTWDGWGEILLMKRTGDKFETTALQAKKGGWNDHLTEALGELPACAEQAPVQSGPTPQAN